MNRDLAGLVRTVVALALFALVTSQTAAALRANGSWSGKVAVAPPAPDDPVVRIEGLLTRSEPAVPTPTRDPFQVGAAPAPLTHTRVTPHTTPVPPPPPMPVVTAIVWDADPRALVRWKGREWTVRPGGLFDEFQVTSITRDKVVLSRGTETIVLQRNAQGD